MRALKVEFKDGRATEAPQLHGLSMSLDDMVSGSCRGDWEWIMQKKKLQTNRHGGWVNAMTRTQKLSEQQLKTMLREGEEACER